MSTPALFFETLGTTVRIERIKRRWRQQDLALAAKASQSDVSQLERDRKVIPSRRLRILDAPGIDAGASSE